MKMKLIILAALMLAAPLAFGQQTDRCEVEKISIVEMSHRDLPGAPGIRTQLTLVVPAAISRDCLMAIARSVQKSDPNPTIEIWQATPTELAEVRDCMAHAAYGALAGTNSAFDWCDRDGSWSGKRPVLRIIGVMDLWHESWRQPGFVLDENAQVIERLPVPAQERKRRHDENF